MPGRYSPDTYASRYKVDTAGVTSMSESKADQKAKKDAEMWNFIGDIAPAAGTAIGGVAGAGLGALVGAPTGPGAAATALGGAAIGAPLGGMLGNAVGSAVGQGSKSYGDSLTAEKDDEAANKEQRRQEMLTILMGLRR